MYKSIDPDLSYEGVVQYIETLPEADYPEVFGMTENAENAFRQWQGNTLVETILSVQPRLGGAVGR